MATVVTEVSYVGNGINQIYAVPFEYLSRAHVYVTENDKPVAFTWLTDHSIRVAVAPNNGALLKVKRNTPYEAMWITWQDGSILVSDDLTAQNLQLLFIMQESFSSAVQQTVHNEYTTEIVETVNNYTFLKPIIFEQGVNSVTLTMDHAARRLIFTNPNPCTVILPQNGLDEGFHCLVRNSGGGELNVQVSGAAVLENSISRWSDPTKYGSIMLEAREPYFSYFLMGGLEE